MILLSGLIIGIMKSARLRERETALLEWQKMLLRFKTEISFSARNMSELIGVCQEYSFCRLAATKPEFLMNPTLAMKKAGEEILSFSKDQSLYCDFTAELGVSHTEGQLEHIELYAGLVNANLQEAKTEVQQKSRLYMALGGFGAVTICMLVI